MSKILYATLAVAFLVASASAASALTYQQIRSGYEIGGAQIQRDPQMRNMTRDTAPRFVVRSEPDLDRNDPLNN